MKHENMNVCAHKNLKTKNKSAPGSIHHLHNHHHPSLREQLHFTITNSAPQSTATTPGTARTIFGRLGIRKPSILSLSSPHANAAGGESTARTFSLDDLLRPPPRRKTDRKYFRYNENSFKILNEINRNVSKFFTFLTQNQKLERKLFFF